MNWYGDGRPLVIGHRGAAALAPANTIASFERALDAGVDAIEFDVGVLDDGTLVLAHSDDLHDVTAGAHHGTLRAGTSPPSARCSGSWRPLRTRSSSSCERLGSACTST